MDFDKDELNKRLLAEFEELNKEAQKEDMSSFTQIKIFLLISFIGVISFFSYAWYTDKFAISRTSSELKIVKSDKTPVRVKPKDPGGLKIANTDKLIYNTFADNDAQELPSVTKIIPETEEPIKREELLEQSNRLTQLLDGLLKEDQQAREQYQKAIKRNKEVTKKMQLAANEITLDDTDKKTQQAANKDEEIEIAKEEFADEEVEIAKFEDKQEQVNKIANIQITKEEELPPTLPLSNIEKKLEENMVSKAPKKITLKEVEFEDIKILKPTDKKFKGPTIHKKEEKLYKIQIGSYRSPEDVRRSWNILVNKYGDILSGHNYVMQKADLGQKGMFYRLQVASFKSESDARSTCKKLKDRKQGCFFVK